MNRRKFSKMALTGTDHKPVTIMAGTCPVTVEYAPGTCRIIPMDLTGK